MSNDHTPLSPEISGKVRDRFQPPGVLFDLGPIDRAAGVARGMLRMVGLISIGTMSLTIINRKREAVQRMTDVIELQQLGLTFHPTTLALSFIG